jgi:hypothetical protein
MSRHWVLHLAVRVGVVLLMGSVLSGCGGPAYFLTFSATYDPRTSLSNALPTISLRPGETRKAMVTLPGFTGRRATSLVSEDPRIAIVWRPANPRQVVNIQSIGPGTVLIHRGDFPFDDWKDGRNPVERSEWRASLRRYLSPVPDDATFRQISDEQLWKTVVRSRSTGAIRIIVAEDHSPFWRAAD